MIEIDTIRLLRECDKGIKMGISSIDEVWAYVQNERLKSALNICKDQHNNLNIEIQKLLEKYHSSNCYFISNMFFSSMYSSKY